MPAIKLPTKATVILSIVATALAVLNETTFDFGRTWSAGILVVISILAALGISRLTGEQFRSIIDLTQAEAASVAAVLAIVALWAKDAEIGEPAHAIVAGVIVAINGLLFGPDTIARVKAARRHAPPPA